MTWTKLSDDYADHCWTLSDKAFRLHTEALCWSNRKLLDCVIDKGGPWTWAKYPEAAAELVAAGYWEDGGNHYRIIDHSEYQRSRTAVLKQRDANRANGQRGGRPPRQQTNSATNTAVTETDSLTDSPTGSLTQPLTESVRKTQSVSESVGESKSKRDGTGYVLNSPEYLEEGGSKSGTSLEPPDRPPPHFPATVNGEPESDGPYGPRCPEHRHIEHPPNCRGCQRARVDHESHQQARAEYAAAQRKKAAALADACPRCHGSHWVHGDDGVPLNPAVRCDHQHTA